MCKSRVICDNGTHLCGRGTGGTGVDLTLGTFDVKNQNKRFTRQPIFVE